MTHRFARQTFSLLGLLVLFAGTIARAESYADSLIADRAKNDMAIREERIGPFTAIGQASLRDGLALRVSVYPDTLLLGVPTADVGVPTLEVQFRQAEGRVYLRTPLGGRFELRGKPIGPVPTPYSPGDTLQARRFLLQIYQGATTARIMAFDPDLPTRQQFRGLHWFDPDERWRVTASVEPIADPDTVGMVTSLGLTKYYVQRAHLRFTTPGGDEEVLTLFAPASGAAYGFVPFTDATTGVSTHGGGRYLDVELPDPSETTLVLDFNRAYNPYCAYTHYYNCPVPPPENNLPIEVHAGEKAYK